MLKILIFVLLSAMPSYAQESINLCKQNLIIYYNQDSSDFYFPNARVDHIIFLISNSLNKFKLISDLYLHYSSLENNNKLSIILANCLIDLLKINNTEIKKYFNNRDSFFGFISNNKFNSPISKIISGSIINKKFLEINHQALVSLKKLSQKEQSFFKHDSVKKEDFDNIIIPDQILKASPELVRDLLKAYEKIMGVFYEGHDVFTRQNSQLVQDFIKLLKNSPVKNNFYSALVTYKLNPSPQSYNLIKAKVRALLEALTGERMAKSPSEIWARLLNITEEVQAQIKDDDLLIKSQINQIKRDYGSSNVEPIENAAYQFITILEPYSEDVRRRIMGVILN